MIPNQYNNMNTLENKLSLGTPSKEMMDMVNVGGSAATLGNYMSSLPGKTPESRGRGMASGDIKSRERVMAVQKSEREFINNSQDLYQED